MQTLKDGSSPVPSHLIGRSLTFVGGQNTKIPNETARIRENKRLGRKTPGRRQKKPQQNGESSQAGKGGLEKTSPHHAST
jgi:hypothetical protein